MSYNDIDKSKNSWWKDVLAICLAVGASVLYRMGGSGNYARFFRPLGIGITVTIILFIIYPHWSCLLAGGASAGLSTTYFPFINKWMGLPKDDKKWFNWLAVGLFLSLAILPWVFFSHQWIGFLIRTFTLTGWTVLWCEMVGNAVVEELGRGFFIIITLLLLLIGS